MEFRKYWRAGFFFTLASSCVNSLFTIYMNYVSSLPAREWSTEWMGGTVTFRYPVQLEWTVATITATMAFLIFVPWTYGRLIEIFHKEFTVEKKS